MSLRALFRAIAPVIGIFLLAGCVFALAYYYDNKYIAGPPYGSDGSITLSDVDLDHPVVLVDGWQLALEGGHEMDTFIGQYSNFSYVPGGDSAFGSATYRLTLQYKGAEAERALVLLIPEVFTDFSLYVDGQEALLQDGGSEVGLIVGESTELVFEVTNSSHYYSGLVYPPTLGTAQKIAGIQFVNNMVTSVLVLVPLVAALSAFAVRRRRDGDEFVRDFGILCAALAIAGLHTAAWRFGISGSWWYATEDAAWMIVLVCASALAARASGALEYSVSRVALGVLVALPAIAFVWVGALIPAFPLSIEAYGLFQTAARMLCWALLVAFAVVGTRARTAEARGVLYGCAVLGASLIANLLDNNAYEPLYGLWQNEYASLGLAGVFAWMLIVRVRRLRADRERVRDLEVQVRAAKTGLLHLRQGEKATRIARHDLQHHVAALQKFASQGAWVECQSYINDLSERQHAQAPLRYSDNLVVNAVMAAYLSPAQAHGVNVSWSVAVPETIALRSTELVVLLSNLLSNAVESCDRVQQAGKRDSFVDLILRVEGDKLVVRCKNTASADVSFLATSKIDASHHGFGLPAMRQVVERHKGMLVVDGEEGVVTVRAALCLDDIIDNSKEAPFDA